MPRLVCFMLMIKTLSFRFVLFECCFWILDLTGLVVIAAASLFDNLVGVYQWWRPRYVESISWHEWIYCCFSKLPWSFPKGPSIFSPGTVHLLYCAAHEIVCNINSCILYLLQDCSLVFDWNNLWCRLKLRFLLKII